MQGIYSQYLSDPEIEKSSGDEALIKYMLRVEIVLAKVQAEQGIIPKNAAKEIAIKLKHFCPLPDSLAEGTLQNGMPTISLLALAKKELSEKSQNYLHWGATSQDIMDTATVLIIRDVLEILKSRLEKIVRRLKKLAKRHKDTHMMGRTRTQQAVPISFGLKVNNWTQPLERHLLRLKELKARLLVVQFGGASGNLAAVGVRGMDTGRLLGKELKLNYAGVWHTQRDNIAEFSNWLALVAGSFGKMAEDILLLSQTEIGEVIENSSGGGKSSTMPHKNNPVLSEAILSLSRFVARLSGNNIQAMIHSQERDASAWSLEWMALPLMMKATGAILNHAVTISENIQVNKKAMQINLEKLNGLVFSEQAVFILCQYTTRKDAKNQVGIACQMVSDEGIHLADALNKLLPKMDVNWRDLLQAKHGQGATNELICSLSNKAIKKK